jgi:hypothetical protein
MRHVEGNTVSASVLFISGDPRLSWRFHTIPRILCVALDKRRRRRIWGILIGRLGMGNILNATITIKGTRPLLWHHFGPDAIPLEKQERTGVPGNDPEEWRKTVLMTQERQLYIKPTYVFGSVRDGAKHTSRKRGTLQPFVSATLQVMDDLILIDRFVPPEPLPTLPTEPVYLDIQSVKNPATRARNVRYRIAAASGWSCAFHLQWDRTVVSRNEMEAAIIDAGRLVGLCDGRAVGYGRFIVEQFDVAE